MATCPDSRDQADIGVIASAALVWIDGVIHWRGRERDIPDEYDDEDVYDAQGKLVVPGLIDCHTHLALGGWRAEEFEARIKGRSYLDIAREGGGIASTMRATRNCSEEQLLERCHRFSEEMLKLGVTALECKSGYGLDIDAEKKLLRVYQRLSGSGLQRIVPTFLGAHSIPPELRDNRESYVDLVIKRMIPAVARQRLAVFCDVFLEESAFSREEARCILAAGKKAGLGSKIHADQLSDGGGATLAAELGAISADHLEHVSDEGVKALAAGGVVAVSLPIATLYLNQKPMPARKLIEAGARVAVATDFNPGSAPSYHLPLAMTLACTIQKMTPAEALKGATIHAARAIGFQDAIGSLDPGKAADFAIIDAADVNHWLYHFRPNACLATFIGGFKPPPRRGSSRPVWWIEAGLVPPELQRPPSGNKPVFLPVSFMVRRFLQLARKKRLPRNHGSPESGHPICLDFQYFVGRWTFGSCNRDCWERRGLNRGDPRFFHRNPRLGPRPRVLFSFFLTITPDRLYSDTQLLSLRCFRVSFHVSRGFSTLD